jgi:hypothetical protein
MLLVRTRLGLSAIEGIGLFAAEDIAQGTVVWRFMEGFDLLLEPAAIAALPEVAREECLKYAYLHEGLAKYVYCLDNARFFNHSEAPNTRGLYPAGEVHGIDVAVRPIKAGEEITCDYRQFDAEFGGKLGRR